MTLLMLTFKFSCLIYKSTSLDLSNTVTLFDILFLLIALKIEEPINPHPIIVIFLNT